MEPNNLVNKDLDIESLKEEYQKEKFIVIKNFLQIGGRKVKYIL